MSALPPLTADGAPPIRLRGRAGQVALLAAVALAGCSAFPTYPIIPADVPPPLRVGADADGTQVTLARTQQLVVMLPANPTTGYGWNYQVTGEPVLYPSGDTPVFVPAAADGKVGTGGATVFTFRADGTGTTAVRFVYGRPWDTPTEQDKVVKFDVVAR